ncbi:hypothetical protein AGMMS50284_4890 [Clostridia bacterium]|nr:hypothetical protein AGMMS50284_4890 [Clostridia bacterium]
MQKKYFVIILVAIMILFSACGEKENNVNDQTSEMTSLATTEPTDPVTEPITETATQPIENQENDIACLGEFCDYKGKIYYSLQRIGETFENDMFISLPDSIKEEAGRFAIQDDYIYYIKKLSGSGGFEVDLYRCKIDGTEIEVLTDDVPSWSNFVIYKNKLFYSAFDSQNPQIKAIDINSKKVIDGISLESVPSIHYNHIGYEMKWGSDFIYGYHYDTNKYEKICSDVKNIICADNGYLYYTSLFDQSLYRIELESKDKERIMPANENMLITVKDNKVYYVSKYAGKVIQCFDIEKNEDKTFFSTPEDDGIIELNIQNNFLLLISYKNNGMDLPNCFQYAIDLDNTQNVLCLSKWITSSI